MTHIHCCLGGATVLGDIGQRLGDDEIGARLYSIGEPFLQIYADDNWHRATCCERRERGVKPTIGEYRWMDAAHQVAQFREGALRLLVRLRDEFLGHIWLRSQF